MDRAVLSTILHDWSGRRLDDTIYVPSGVEVSTEIEVLVVPLEEDGKGSPQDYQYLLGIEQVRDVVESLEHFLGRKASIADRLRAVLHYAEYDAFIDPEVFVR